MIAKKSKEYANTKLHADSLNPNDPHRFRLTYSEVDNMESRGYDPIKVKCAIVALMKKMGTAKVPHLFFAARRPKRYWIKSEVFGQEK